MLLYTAKLFIENKLVDEKSDNNLEELFIWMITKAQNRGAHYSGLVINNKTHEVVRKFRTDSID